MTGKGAIVYHGPEGTTPPPLKLVGTDGNVFAVIGHCKAAARKARWPERAVRELVSDMMSSDYDHALQVALKNFDVE